jgi:hypothetical protein
MRSGADSPCIRYYFLVSYAHELAGGDPYQSGETASTPPANRPSTVPGARLGIGNPGANPWELA